MVQSGSSKNICPNPVKFDGLHNKLRCLTRVCNPQWRLSASVTDMTSATMEWGNNTDKAKQKLSHKDVNVLDTSKRRERVWHFHNLTSARQSDIPEHTENAAFELWGKGSLEDGLHRDKLPAGAWKPKRERCKIQSAEGWAGQNNPSEAFSMEELTLWSQAVPSASADTDSTIKRWWKW